MKQTIVSIGILVFQIKLELQSVELCSRQRAAMRQLITSTPIKAQMMDLLLKKLPSTIRTSISRQIPEYQYTRGTSLFLNICHKMYIVVDDMPKKLNITARSLFCSLQSSKCWLMLPQQSQTQSAIIINENIERTQTNPLQQSHTLRQKNRAKPNNLVNLFQETSFAYEKLIVLRSSTTIEQTARLKKIACNIWFIMTRPCDSYESSLYQFRKDSSALILSIVSLQYYINGILNNTAQY